MSPHKLFRFLFATLIALPAICETPKKVLRVGGIVALSGPASVHGESIRDGLLLAAGDLKNTGKEIELIFEDDGSNSAKTVSSVQNLFSRGVNFFIGMTWSFQAESAAPVIQRLGALGFAPACSSQIAGGPNSAMLFGTTPSTEKIPVLTQWFLKNSIKKASMIYAASSWGSVHEDILRKAAEASDVKLVSVDTYNYGDEIGSIPALITKQKSLNPDVLFVTGSKEGTAVTVKKLVELGLKLKLIGTDDIRDAVEAGLISPRVPNIDIYYLSLPITSEFTSRYEKKFGKKPYVYADSAYDGLMLFSKAFEATDGSPSRVREFIISNPMHNGLSGPLRFDSDGDVHRSQFEIRNLAEILVP